MSSPQQPHCRYARHRLALLIPLLLLLISSLLLRPAPASAQATLSCVNKTTANGVGYANYAVYASGNTLYVGSASYAIFTGKLSISTDGGATFTERTTATGLGNTSVRGITGDGGTVYVATGNGLSISTDGGTTFTNKTTTNGLGNNAVWSVYAIGSNVYAGTSGGVSISTDGGATFTNKTTADGLGSNAVWGGVYAAGNTLYAATNGGLAISTDGGATFTNKTTADGLGNNTVRGVYASGNTIYAATDGGLSISTDGGATFTNKTTANGLGNNGVSGVYVSGNTVYAATNGGLSISTDGGATFTNYTTTNGLVGNTVTSVYAVGSTVYVGAFGGLSICTLPTPPVSQVQGKGITIASGDTTPSSADGTDFGSTTIGSSLVQAFTISNTGSADLTSVAVTLSGSSAFNVSDHPAATISPGSSSTFTVTFAPTANGVVTATVNIASNQDPYTFVVGGAVPTPGAALDFDGANDYVTLPTTLNNQFSANQITLEGWFYPTASSGSSLPMLIGEAYTGDSQISFALYQEGTAVRCGFYSGSWQQTGAVNLTLNQWQHLACTYDQQAIQVYVNGEGMAGRGATAALPAGNGEWYLGRRWDLAEYYTGRMDEVRIWNRALTASEIANNMNCEPIGNPSGLVARYGFNQGTALANNSGVTSLADSSSNAINGALSGFTLSGSASNWVAPGSAANGVACVTAPEIDVQGNSVSITSGDTTPSTTDDTDFGRLLTSDTVAHTFTINNSGAAALTGVAVTVTGSSAFQLTATPASSVAAGESSDFTLSFTPSTNGVYTATVSIASNDSNENPYTFVVQGIRTGSNVAVGKPATQSSTYDDPCTGSASKAVDGNTSGHVSACSFSTTNNQPQDWWQVDLGAPYLIQVIDLWNRTDCCGERLSNFDLLISTDGTNWTTFYYPGAAPTTTSFVINAMVRYVKVQLRGQNYLTLAEVQVWGPAFPEIDVQGNGVSIATGDSTPAAADHTNFGGVAVNSGSVVRAFTIRNTGTVALPLSGSPLVSVNGNSAFTVSTQPASNSIAAGGSSTFTVTFAPTTAGVVTATVSIANDDSNENPYTFVVGGTGSQPLICVNKTTTNGLGNNQVNGVYANGSTIYAATYRGLSISTDGGATFTNKTTANGLGHNTVYGVYASGSTVYAATDNGLAISTDGGATFTNKTTANGLGDNSLSGVYVSGSTVYAATGGGVSISTDGGASFTNRTTANGLGDDIVTGVYASGNTVYATTYGGGLAISTDGGATFISKTTANGLGDNYVYGVYAVGSTVYAATADGLSISTDGGASFSNKTTADGLGGDFISGVYVIDSTVYVATDNGLSISADGGASFTNKTPDDSGLGDYYVSGVYASGSTVYASTDGGLTLCTATVSTNPEIDVQGSMVSIPSGDTTPSPSDNTDFGRLTTSGTLVYNFTINNSGAAALTGVAVTVDGAGFSLTNAPAISVAVGSSSSFTLTFAPTTTGAYTATVSIASNDSDENPYTFVVQGIWTGSNVALGKPATQSSTYEDPCTGPASKAVDGNTSGNTGDCSFSTTNNQPQDWWQVDLGTPYLIQVIDLWNRTDCCGERLSNFDLLVSTDGANWTTFYYPGAAPTTTSFVINRVVRYVKVQLRGQNYLTLAEVQVWGPAFPEIDVQGNGVSIANGDDTPTAADQSAFGNQLPGGTTMHAFTIHNRGAATLALSGSPVVALSGNSAFTVSSQPASSSLATNGSVPFTITFAPTAVGLVTATVSIANNDSNETPYTFVVSGVGQTADAQLNGVDCLLIDAINAANSDAASGSCPAGSGADTITLLQNVTLTAVDNANYNFDGANGLPQITSAITIEGAGYTLSRAAEAPPFRFFYVTADGILTLNDLTLHNGDATPQYRAGGALYIAWRGAATVNRSTFTANKAGSAGAIYSDGDLTVNQSTISGNVSTGNGGGIDNWERLTVNNSTISGNSAGFNGGGIHNAEMVTVTNSTVSANSAINSGGGIYNNNEERLTLVRSLISGNRAPAGAELGNSTGNPPFSGPGIVNANNANLFGESSQTNAQALFNVTPGATDRTATSDGTHPTALAAILDPTLADNGGPSTGSGAATLTHALVAGSPALDAAGDSGLDTDQRGVTRPQGAADDIGAFELAVVAAPEIDVQGNGVSIANGDSTPVAADHTAFGNVTVGSSLVRTFTISNSGNADLTDVVVTVDGSVCAAGATSCIPAGDFTLVSAPDATIAPGSSSSFTIEFAPTAAGQVEAVVSIASNDSDENPYTFAVNGNGVAPTTITIVLDAQPDLPTNLGFQSSFGPFILDDPATDDGDAYTKTRTFTVTPGTYTVRRNNPAGWFTTAIACTPVDKATIALPQRSATITVADGDAVTCTYTVDRAARINARAFNDLVRRTSNLGKRNAGDPWLNNQPMTLTTSPTQTLGSGVTAPVGNVSQTSFINLRPGSYTLCTSFPTGWTLTNPMAVDPAYGQPCKRVTLMPGQVATVLFGAYETTVVASDADTPADETITDDDNIVAMPYDPAEDETLADVEGALRLFLPLVNR
jgi:hypothetical protein